MAEEETVAIFDSESCELGDGPGYDPATDTAWWFDIVRGRLFEKRFPNGGTRVHELGMMASALAIVDANRQLVAAETGLFLRDRRTGATTLHVPVEADDPRTRSNDARVHPAGAFWVGTMDKEELTDSGSIWWYRAGDLRRIFTGIGIVNSICFAADGSFAHFGDSKKNVIWKVATDPVTGLPRGEPEVFYRHDGKSGIDGSVMDADGLLWNARWGGSRIDAHAPDGRVVHSVSLPVHQPSCPAFVGPAADRMIVTSAWKGMNAKRHAADPKAGLTLLLGRPVRGRFDPPVLL